MQTISFKAGKERGKPKSEIIRESVHCYARYLKKEEMKQQILRASYITRQQTIEICKELENTYADGL